MEFFSEIERTDKDVKNLQQLLTIRQLPQLCASISSVISNDVDSGSIYCVWGQFDVHREEIKYGVRFSLPSCPNALAWSIAIDPDTENMVVHCTINKKQHDDEFVESIEQFVQDFTQGIAKAGSR